jgi:hypothetical protein
LELEVAGFTPILLGAIQIQDVLRSIVELIQIKLEVLISAAIEDVQIPITCLSRGVNLS